MGAMAIPTVLLSFLLLLLPTTLAMPNSDSSNSPLQYCVRTCQTEAHMRLYMHQFSPKTSFDMPTNPNRNEEFLIAPKTPFATGFGSTFIHGWTLTNTTNPRGTVVAGFQGAHIQSGTGNADNWYYSSNIVFESGSYAGSTLQVMGADNHKTVKQWSIVGGTGQFVMAKGIIIHKIDVDPSKDEIVRELNFHIIYDADYARILGAQYDTSHMSEI